MQNFLTICYLLHANRAMHQLGTHACSKGCADSLGRRAVDCSIDSGMFKRICWRHMRWLFDEHSSPETVAGLSVHDINPLLSDVDHVGSPVWLPLKLDCFCSHKIGLACRHAVVGRNCRFLQGPQTDQAEVKRLRDAMTADPPKPITVKLLNYRVDGQPFWNNLHVAPIRSACGEVSWVLALYPDVVMQLTGSDKTCSCRHMLHCVRLLYLLKLILFWSRAAVRSSCQQGG